MVEYFEAAQNSLPLKSRREFVTLFGVAALSLLPLTREFLAETYPNSEFTKNAIPLTNKEIAALLSQHKEEVLPFDRNPTTTSRSLLEGSFKGNGSPVYLGIPGIYSDEPRLNVFDIIVNDSQRIQTAVVSSDEPESKGVQLGPLSGVNTFRIVKRFEGREQSIEPEEIQPVLTYPVNHTFQRVVDESAPVFVPRRGLRSWDDAIVRTVVIPYMQDGNYRLVSRKVATAENSRFRSLYADTGRTYDDDWATKIEVTPKGRIVDAYDQREGHITKKFDGIFLFKKHPVEEVVTPNGMLRGVQSSSFYDGAYVLDRPIILSAESGYGVLASSNLDEDLQEVSIEELLREGKIKEGDHVIVDFNKKVSRRNLFQGGQAE